MIIPIALANFDFPISKTIYSAVIKEGFYIDDFVDVNDSIALSSFLSEYRKRFRGYVEEAIELARNIETLPLKRKKEFITNIGFVSPVEKEFEADVRELEIKKLCANNDGIEEICTWKRQESFAFDATAFKNRHPEIVEDPQYHSASKPSVAISVYSSRDYV